MYLFISPHFFPHISSSLFHLSSFLIPLQHLGLEKEKKGGREKKKRERGEHKEGRGKKEGLNKGAASLERSDREVLAEQMPKVLNAVRRHLGHLRRKVSPKGARVARKGP